MEASEVCVCALQLCGCDKCQQGVSLFVNAMNRFVKGRDENKIGADFVFFAKEDEIYRGHD